MLTDEESQELFEAKPATGWTASSAGRDQSQRRRCNRAEEDSVSANRLRRYEMESSVRQAGHRSDSESERVSLYNPSSRKTFEQEFSRLRAEFEKPTDSC